MKGLRLILFQQVFMLYFYLKNCDLSTKKLGDLDASLSALFFVINFFNQYY